MQYSDKGPAPVISTTNWVITILISAIPVVNIIMFIIWAFSDTTNPNKRNWAKASLIWILIGVVLYVLFFILFGVAMFAGMD